MHSEIAMVATWGIHFTPICKAEPHITNIFKILMPYCLHRLIQISFLFIFLCGLYIGKKLNISHCLFLYFKEHIMKAYWRSSGLLIFKILSWIKTFLMAIRHRFTELEVCCFVKCSQKIYSIIHFYRKKCSKHTAAVVWAGVMMCFGLICRGTMETIFYTNVQY